MQIAKKGLWITAQQERAKKLRDLRDTLIVDLSKNGFSYGDIETVIRIDRGGAHRIVNTKNKRKVSKPVTVA